jgi:hypothetical protein
MDRHEFQLVIEDRIIWNCEQFIDYSNADRYLDGKVMLPQQASTNPNIIKMNGWEFDVRSTIHIGANSNDVL